MYPEKSRHSNVISIIFNEEDYCETWTHGKIAPTYSLLHSNSLLTAAADLQNEGIDLLGVCLGRNRGVNGFLQPPARPTASAAHLLTFHPLVSVLIVGLSSGARNVPCYTRHIMQNFRTFRDSPVIPLRRSPRARDGDGGGGGGCCNNCE